MDSIQYYKSLISDQEVIKALERESKARDDGPFPQKPRIRLNLDFFQRTVTNLVSSNKRIPTIPEFIPKERKEEFDPPRTLCAEYVRKGFLLDADDNLSSSNLNECFKSEFKRSDSPPTPPPPPKWPTKSESIQFNVNFDKHECVNSASSSTSKDISKYDKRKLSISSDSSDDSIISISSTESVSSSSSSLSSDESDVITISDSDGDSNSNKPAQVKSEKLYRKKCKKKSQKKRRRKNI